LRIPILAVIDARESIPPILDFVIGAEKSYGNALHLGAVPAPYEQVSDSEIAHRLLKDIVQVIARGYSRQVGREFFLRGRQIQPVKSRVVKEIALDAERLVIQLFPFNGRLDAHVHRGEIQCLRTGESPNG